MDAKEAAKRLGVSRNTVLRWIREGKIFATVKNGPYGEQYDIPEEEVEAAKERVNLPVIVQNMDITKFKEAVEQSVKGEISSLRKELEEVKELLRREQEARERAERELAERDLLFAELLKEIQEELKTPWWEKIFKKRKEE
jgi:excisionase family DNA binding protein